MGLGHLHSSSHLPLLPSDINPHLSLLTYYLLTYVSVFLPVSSFADESERHVPIKTEPQRALQRLIILHFTKRTFRSHHRLLNFKQPYLLLRTLKMNPFDELLKFHEATRKEIDELKANVEKCNIDRMLLKYDSDKIVQDLRFTEAFLRDSYRDEDGKELLRNAESKADIVADANIYMSGLRKDREKFTSLYNQDPETVLQYHQKGLRYVIRLLEYHANLRLHRRHITPEVEEQHFTFIRLLLLSGFLSDKELEPPVKEHSYRYWRAVRDTMGW